MPKIAGFKTIKSPAGKVVAVQLSLKHHAKLLEDMIDAAEMEKARKEPNVPWEDVKRKLDKKFGFKD